MPLALLIQALLPLITHLIDKLMEKDTTVMSDDELAVHEKDLACAKGVCEMAKREHA